MNNKWNFNYLEKELKNYDKRDEFLECSRFGWPLNAEDTEVCSEIPKNQKGAQENFTELQKYIKKEIDRKSVIGPFLKKSFRESSPFFSFRY